MITSAPAQTFSSETRLTIPRVAIVAGRSYDEIAPAGLKGRDAMLVLARQDLSLLVDERGADVDAEAVAVAVAVAVSVGAIPREIDIDGPFLVAQLARDIDLPFVLAWVGSENGLTRWDKAVGRSLSATEARPFVGASTLDSEASINASPAAVLRVLGPEETNRASVKRESVAGWFRDRLVDLKVIADGVARVTTTREASTDARLTRDGVRTLLGMRAAGGSGHESWDVSRDGDRLASLRAHRIQRRLFGSDVA